MVRIKYRHVPLSSVARMLGISALVAALLVFAGLRVLRPSPPALESDASLAPGTSATVNATILDAVSVTTRRYYKYSVIPGGARNAEELARAIATDEVVANQYGDVDPSTVHAQTVRVERMAHVSYRIENRVYWTKKPVRLHEGETILTNGQTEIRARCGNAISMSPLLPTSDDEPESTEFEALTDDSPMLVASELHPSVPSAPPFGDVSGDGPWLPPLALPFGVVGVGGTLGAAQGQAIEGIPLDAPPATAAALCTPTSGANAAGTLAEGDPCPVVLPNLDSAPGSSAPSSSAPGSSAPGSSAPGPSLFGASGFNPSVSDPSEFSPPVFQPLLGPEINPTSFDATNMT